MVFSTEIGYRSAKFHKSNGLTAKINHQPSFPDPQFAPQAIAK
jgi:hypothetical protein